MFNECKIIGQGIAGLSVGFRLAQRGVKVEFIGPENTEKSASKAAVGVSTQKGVLLPRDPLFQLKTLGHYHLPKWFKEIESVSGIPIFTNQKSGATEKTKSREQYQKTMERIYKRDFLGCYRIKVEANEKDVRLQYPEDYFFDVEALLNSLREANLKLGASFKTGAVKSFGVSGDQYIVQTEKQSFKCSNILLAAGFESEAFLKQLGIDKHKLEGIAGRSFVSKTNQDELCEVQGQNARVVISGLERIGSTSHPFGSEKSDQERLDLEKLSRAFELEVQAKPVWGVRARFRDRCPRFGLVHELGAVSKLWISCGFYKSGLQLSDLIAQVLVRKMFGEFSEASPDFGLMKNFIW